MRNPISVPWKPFEMEADAQPQIDTAKRAFADYTETAPRKSTKSKHGLMGPVGKVLSEIKRGRRDPGYLKGYVVRVHEMQSRRGGGPSAAAMEQLERGIDTTVNLLSATPVTFHDKILDRLDYGLYYELRKRQAASKEARTQMWRAQIKAKYGTVEELAAAWDEASISFDDLYLPPKTEASRSRKATNRQKDVADFWESQGKSLAVDEEEDE
jgi:hypothetical protein